jgi:hypothetical protein
MPEDLRLRNDRTFGSEQIAESGWRSTLAGIRKTVQGEEAGADASPQSDAAESLSTTSAGSAPGDLEPVDEPVARTDAAEDAATRIRDAEQEANAVRERAARTASDIRARAIQQAQAELAAARRVVEEAEKSSVRIRSAANQYADARRHEADEHAAQIIGDAEHRIASLADIEEEAHSVLLANIAASENRLHELGKSLRTVASSLEGVVEDEANSGSPRGRPVAERAAPPEGSVRRLRGADPPHNAS